MLKFAVTTNEQITFFDSNWNQTTSAAHQFHDLSAITFDETEGTLFFTTQSGNTGNIFSLKLSNDAYTHQVDQILQKTDGEQIEALAFDLLERELYWADSQKKVIYQASVDAMADPKILIQFKNDRIPRGIAIDPCRRNIYYTNSNHSNPSIERVSLDGSHQEILIRNKEDEKILFMPVGIAVDQFSKRIYWVDNLEGNHFVVESAALDGTDRRTLVRDVENNPYGITVDRDNVYWTDHTHQAVWKIAKNATIGYRPEIVRNISDIPLGIIFRNNLLSTQANNPECMHIVDKVKEAILTENSSHKPSSTTPKPQIYCFNNGDLNPKTNTCICPKEFSGLRCELPICHNYCLQGICSVTSTGYAKCKCDDGFAGERCEIDLCQGFCLNGGHCELEQGEPVCHCTSLFKGRHCDSMMVAKMCEAFCENTVYDAGDHDLSKICGDCNPNSNSTAELREPTANNFDDRSYQYQCNDSLYRTIIIACVGVTASLVLIFLIVKSMRRMYQPLRPKIKKTFVVTKNVTPLTCRPTTEQCEITIEDCCNMNICDTPCFDPKTLQREARKEDKKNLLSNMDGELY
ncbi:Protein cueball [Pseudolycoriella hygida]|uniref:Protein cueball n=1 Tax=Pseudolycoriella hygida TaxID=35572 RepID=A0A9Q0N6M0_9DIPT|nr:Protein cueball [Pseudolycoriella hygida]